MCAQKVFLREGRGDVRCMPRSMTACDIVHGTERGLQQGVCEVRLVYYRVYIAVGGP